MGGIIASAKKKEWCLSKGEKVFILFVEKGTSYHPLLFEQRWMNWDLYRMTRAIWWQNPCCYSSTCAIIVSLFQSEALDASLCTLPFRLLLQLLFLSKEHTFQSQKAYVYSLPSLRMQESSICLLLGWIDYSATTGKIVVLDKDRICELCEHRGASTPTSSNHF